MAFDALSAAGYDIVRVHAHGPEVKGGLCLCIVYRCVLVCEGRGIAA